MQDTISQDTCTTPVFVQELLTPVSTAQQITRFSMVFSLSTVTIGTMILIQLQVLSVSAVTPQSGRSSTQPPHTSSMFTSATSTVGTSGPTPPTHPPPPNQSSTSAASPTTTKSTISKHASHPTKVAPTSSSSISSASVCKTTPQRPNTTKT